MAQMINTNIMSLNAQRQLNKSQNTQNEAMERLSSGLRINSAKDDAAGLAIATGMESQIRGINQAVRNANDGISMSQTAEGAMDEMTNILQRMRELSIQAANDTNSSSNRASIQKEVDQLYEELDRISTVTQFNGVNLLDGSGGSTTLQIGANSGERLTFSIDAVTTTDLNLNAVSGLGDLNGGRVSGAVSPVGTAGAIPEGTVAINGVDIGAVATTAGTIASANVIATAINDKQGLTGVTATAYNVVEGAAGIDGKTDGSLTISVDGATAIPIGATSSPQDLVDTINRDVGGVTAALNSEGGLILSNDTGKSITIGGAGAAQVGLVADSYEGYVSLTSADGSPVEVSTGTNGTVSDVQDMGFNVSVGSDVIKGGEVKVSNGAITANDGIVINGVELGAVTGTSAADKAFAINAISDETGVSASATTTIEYSVEISTMAAEGATGFTINGAVIDMTATNSALAAPPTTLDEVVGAINASGIQGVVASASEDGKLILTSQSGNDVNVTTTTGNPFVGNTTTGTGLTTRGEITLTGQDGADVTITSTASTEAEKEQAFDKLGLTDMGGNSGAVGKGLSVNTAANASNSINRIDDALQKISDSRANLGAIQNRLGSTISNLENVSQNLSGAKSRIYDADFAAETSKMSKAQILQQAGTSMLSQANASTQNVLSLLQG
ncbi:flagellin [Psychromonas sp. psych-6C06]|uniref:flagellin N-terminal helical domain-containing protein n=1 Tax=Psychromonas sp. psych-6C06 TaxID=2058089 RepID=UPI000C3335F1|nr:flagellin [Psychromonas sp. psych-6C06]PKF62758.1 flagellin [Psychromonas sp. psych-6C06]